MRGLKDKRILITGGASGIGAAIAARFLEEGSRVCVLDRDGTACGQIKHELRGFGECRLNFRKVGDVGLDSFELRQLFADVGQPGGVAIEDDDL